MTKTTEAAPTVMGDDEIVAKSLIDNDYDDPNDYAGDVARTAIALTRESDRAAMQTALDKRRETFCLAQPGSDDQITCWLAGFDAARAALDALKGVRE